MKVKIRQVIGELAEPLTFGKNYLVCEETPIECVYHIVDDSGDDMVINVESCIFLNGGSWEIVE